MNRSASQDAESFGHQAKSPLETLLQRAQSLAEAQGHLLTEKWAKIGTTPQHGKSCRRCDCCVVADAGEHIPEGQRIRGSAVKRPCDRSHTVRVLLKPLADELKVTQKALTQWLETQRLEGRMTLMVERRGKQEAWVSEGTEQVIRAEFQGGAKVSKWAGYFGVEKRDAT